MLHRSPAAVIAVFAVVLAGCQSATLEAPLKDGHITATYRSRAGSTLTLAPAVRAGENAYFPLTPGLTSDFRVTRLGVGVRYVRVTTGEPEMFFGRLATPWVYGDIPGMERDSILYGLRQYYSVAPDGALWFHGAQNNGFMSYTEPPVRALLAEPVAGEAWNDTVVFQSFFPGGIPFFTAHQAIAWTLSERTKLRVPAGVYHAYRASQVIGDAAAPASFARGDVATSAWSEQGVQARPEDPDILKGFWFARRRGVVARDWPSGPGPTNTNITTLELLGQGTGPIPPALPAP